MCTQEKELLEELKDYLNLDYISDLRFSKKLKHVSAVVNSIPSDRYSLHIWKDAVHYLTGYDGLFCTCEEAKSYLVNHI